VRYHSSLFIVIAIVVTTIALFLLLVFLRHLYL